MRSHWDTATQTFHANQAIVEADQANVRQLETLQCFGKIYTPFDGIITARNTDIGNLIDSGSSGGVKTDLFHIAQPDTLRVYVDVPESYAPSVKIGLIADLSLAEFPGRTFQGKVVRTSEAINMTTRTLQVEIDVDNPSGTLLTGSYAEVKMKVPEVNSTYLLPVETLSFRSQNLLVSVVKAACQQRLRRLRPGGCRLIPHRLQSAGDLLFLATRHWPPAADDVWRDGRDGHGAARRRERNAGSRVGSVGGEERGEERAGAHAGR